MLPACGFDAEDTVLAEAKNRFKLFNLYSPQHTERITFEENNILISKGLNGMHVWIDQGYLVLTNNMHIGDVMFTGKCNPCSAMVFRGQKEDGYSVYGLFHVFYNSSPLVHRVADVLKTYGVDSIQWGINAHDKNEIDLYYHAFRNSDIKVQRNADMEFSREGFGIGSIYMAYEGVINRAIHSIEDEKIGLWM